MRDMFNVCDRVEELNAELHELGYSNRRVDNSSEKQIWLMFHDGCTQETQSLSLR
jgi:hypothetical protein